MTMLDRERKSIVFIHPDLGIGGAERLVIDAAVGLQSRGYKVTIFTSHCDRSHCFEEARDGTLDVRVRGNAIFPASIAGRLSILLAIIRQLCLVLSIAVFSSELKKLAPDVFFVDQLSACVPCLKLLAPNAKVLFYGHFPDRLLAKREAGMIQRFKSMYRMVFDRIESWSTRCADSIVVNSKFTRSVFKQTFASLRTSDMKVVYPCVDTGTVRHDNTGPTLWRDRTVLLSINRYEEKKHLSLAVLAYAGLSSEERRTAKLVIAGGFDSRVRENAATLKQLQKLAESLKISYGTYGGDDANLEEDTNDITFLLSVPDKLKRRLLYTSSLLIYTPQNEHFGIVPIEAMLAGVPVLATNTGGPLETIYDGRTGWLRSPDKVEQWTEVMRKPLIPSSGDNLRAMGQRGRERVRAEFSQEKMTDSLDQEIQRLCRASSSYSVVVPTWLWMTLIVVAGLLAAVMSKGFRLKV